MICLMEKIQLQSVIKKHETYFIFFFKNVSSKVCGNVAIFMRCIVVKISGVSLAN